MEELNRWRYSYEALLNLNCLRLSLVNPAVLPGHTCLGLNAQFQAPPTHLICEWQYSMEEEEKRVCVLVPLPLCALNFLAPIQCHAHVDFLEVKLALLPMAASGLAALSFFGRGNIKQDEFGFIQTVKSDAAEFSLYCRSCSAKITTEAFRSTDVFELPSVDWRDVADHWFGNCCCSFGSCSEVLVSRFQEITMPSKGKLLVGCKTAILHSTDVMTSFGHQKTIPNSNDDRGLKEGLQVSESTKEFTSNNENLNVVIEKPVHHTSFSDVCNASALPNINRKQLSPNCVTNSDSHGILGASCCSAQHLQMNGEHRTSSKQAPAGAVNHLKQARPGMEDQADFIRGPKKPLRTGQWRSLYCYSCFTLLGAYAEDSTIDGVHLFHRCISAIDTPPREQSREQFQMDFASELQEHMHNNSSYRFIIHDVASRMPVLQMVLLNEDTWICVGLSEEAQFDKSKQHLQKLQNEENDQDTKGRTTLEPVLKVMFKHCDLGDEKEARSAQVWAKEHDAEDIFMLEGEIKAVMEHLVFNSTYFSKSCTISEKFTLSFLRKKL